MKPFGHSPAASVPGVRTLLGPYSLVLRAIARPQGSPRRGHLWSLGFEGRTDCHRFSRERWLPDMDLNHDKQIQSLLCYRYTIGQASALKVRQIGREHV